MMTTCASCRLRFATTEDIERALLCGICRIEARSTREIERARRIVESHNAFADSKQTREASALERNESV